MTVCFIRLSVKSTELFEVGSSVKNTSILTHCRLQLIVTCSVMFCLETIRVSDNEMEQFIGRRKTNVF